MWKFVYSKSTSSIYANTSKGYQTRFVKQIGRRKFTTHQKGEEMCEKVPDDRIPVDIIETNVFSINMDHQWTQKKQRITLTWEEYRRNIPEYEKMNLQNINSLNESDMIKHITKEKNIIICVDGDLLKE